MKHLGDITKLTGSEVPLVDIVVGGSPCQNLSIAGNRKGLQGEQSGLFIEQIRIIKEMRENSQRSSWSNKSIRPRYTVWENVPGALTSNNGEDFRIVLEETAKIADENAVIPRPPGKWTNSGCIMGNGWSIAWRIHDAQFWGVPQRRRRIALVADFGGQSAPEILFERESVSGNITESREAEEGIAGDVKASINSASPDTISFQERAGKPGGGKGILIQYEHTGALSTVNNQYVCQNNTNSRVRPGINEEVVYCLQGNGIDRSDVAGCNGRGWRENQSYTLNTVDRPAVYDARGNGNGVIAPTITGDHNAHISDYTAVAVDVIRTSSVVRRLTPLECERLQGYPDGWTDIGDWTDTKGKKRKLSDTARYKALGNSIALPFWEWMAERIVAQYDCPVTMASLFDGIGGFPLVFSRCGCKPVWASEIEPFCVAVTQKRFPDEEDLRKP